MLANRETISRLFKVFEGQPLEMQRSAVYTRRRKNSTRSNGHHLILSFEELET